MLQYKDCLCCQRLVILDNPISTSFGYTAQSKLSLICPDEVDFPDTTAVVLLNLKVSIVSRQSTFEIIVNYCASLSNLNAVADINLKTHLPKVHIQRF